MSSEDHSRIKGKKKAAPNTGTPPDAKKINLPPGADRFCWICHREPASLWCNTCPRSYHASCVNLTFESLNEWVCPECVRVMSAENVDTRPSSLSLISVDEFCNLLQFAMQRLKQHTHEAFLKPVCTKTYPNYTDYVSHPFDLSLLEKNVRWKHYGCTVSFLNDARWIYHNCLIFNGYNHKLSMSAKVLMKVCKQEMEEIDVCPDCYKNANTSDSWFTEPCRRPHLLVWAKLKGFPYWPAKAMRVQEGNIDARFFGAHDRAWVPMNQCFLLSKESPTEIKNRKKGLQNAMEELEIYIQKYKEKYGEYSYSANRTPVTHEDFNSTPTPEKKTFGSMCSSLATHEDKELNSALSTFVTKKRPLSEAPSFVTNTSRDGSEGMPSSGASQGEGSFPCSPSKDSPVPAKRAKGEKATLVPDGAPQGIFEVSAELPGELQMRVSQQDMEDLPKKVNRNVECLVSALKKIERSISSDTNHSEAPQRNKGQDKAPQGKATTTLAKEACKLSSQSSSACDVTGTTTTTGLGEVRSAQRDEAAPVVQTADDFREKLNKTILSIKEKVGGVNPVIAEDPIEDPTEDEEEDEEEEEEEEAGDSEGDKGEAEEKGNGAGEAAKEARVEGSSQAESETGGAAESANVAHEETSRESSSSQGSRAASLAKMFTANHSRSLSSALQPSSSDDSLPTGKDNSTNKSCDTSAKDDIESVRQECKEEMEEYQHILALTLKEMRICLDLEIKKAAAAAAEKQASEVAKAIDETKRKQWCANCWNEAVFYCCWNTSYCDYPCQQAHWPKHVTSCTQTNVSQQVHTTGVSLVNNGALAEVHLPHDTPAGSTSPSSLDPLTTPPVPLSNAV